MNTKQRKSPGGRGAAWTSVWTLSSTHSFVSIQPIESPQMSHQSRIYLFIFLLFHTSLSAVVTCYNHPNHHVICEASLAMLHSTHPTRLLLNCAATLRGTPNQLFWICLDGSHGTINRYFSRCCSSLVLQSVRQELAVLRKLSVTIRVWQTFQNMACCLTFALT